MNPGIEWKAKPLPNGVKDDHEKAHRIINEWAGFLYHFNREVYDKLHALEHRIEGLESRVQMLESAQITQPTSATQHISKPPEPPYQ